MIVSVHIPKTAGTAFGHYLGAAFGERVRYDYGDWNETNTAEAREHNERRRREMLAESSSFTARYDAIHGHFTPRKYLELVPDAQLVTFVREPFQHAVSSYEFARTLPEIAHPGARAFRDRRMTITDLIEAFPNHQSLYLGGVAVEDFAMCGLTEEFAKSIALFQAMFRITAALDDVHVNVTPGKRGPQWPVSSDVRRAIELHRAGDVELYRRATAHFTALCAKYGV